MKFEVVVLLAFLSVCCAVSYHEQSWGNTNGRVLGVERVIVKSAMLQVKSRKVVFPSQPISNVITGIKHIDYKDHPVKVKMLSGGVNYNSVIMELGSQRGHGINSTIIFYG